MREDKALLAILRSRVVPFSTARVRSIHWIGHLKEIRLRNSKTVLRVPRSACVTEGDEVQIRRDGTAHVICKNGTAKIFPSFCSRQALTLGGSTIPLQVKEITSAEEFEAYERLSALHYRNKSKHGRAAVLVARTHAAGFPNSLGYIELASPFYVSKPRANFLNAPFSSGDIRWTEWDAKTTKEYLGIFVRISRCVVAPEFRGLGLGTTLLTAAAAFAKRRWHLSGYLPLYLEISADMLRYVPFTNKAGFAYIGDTQGNLDRVAKDIEYLTRNAKRVRSGEIVREESCGIVDQQVSRMNTALRIMKQHAFTRAQLVRRLTKLSRRKVLRDFALFFQIVSLPKPTYILGLNSAARRFVEKRKQANPLINGSTQRQSSRLSEPLVLQQVSATFRNRIRRNTRTHAVQQAFGISPDDITTMVLRGVSFSVNPGDVVVVTGPSGVGKSVLLDVIAGVKRDGLEVSGDIVRPRNLRASSMRPLSSKRSLIEIFGEPDAETGIRALSQVGLSDAYLYLRRFKELSAGQQYRAMLADLMRRRANLAIIDEFCSTLDPITAHTVAASLGKLARATRLTVLVAAPHTSQFLDALQPSKVITLSSFGDATVKILRK